MKLIEKIVERIGSFSPMIIFVLLCISYLRYFENQTSYPEQTKKEIKQIDKKTGADTELQAYWLYRD
ncbi:MAG TPA: hypothetical protein VGQ04_22035 [Chitinophagaceae bacterium]|jgi:hypothetical protein|nr:hypothetical protein [Chitinophagaceae bacterium]